MNSRLGYVLGGVSLGLFLGIFGLMEPELHKLGLWTFAITGAGGGILGASLHATQGWDSLGPPGYLLRLISGLGLVGLILGVLASAIGAIRLTEVPAAVGLGLLAAVGLSLEGLLVRGDGDPERTGREIATLWFVVLGTVAVASGLLAASWLLSK